MRNSHATSNFVASGQVWLHLNGRDVVQLSYSSSNCYHLALQLLPQRLTSSPFALLSRGERAEVLRFLPMMEVGNRCGVRCFHKSVQCFFFLKLDILKIVEKIWFFVTYKYASLPKNADWRHLEFAALNFFLKKKEALLFENFAHWDPAKLLEDVQQKLLPVSGVGSWCLGPGTEVPPRLQRVVRGISQQRSFLVETSAWKCQAPRWGVYMQHVSEVTILHDEFPPRIKDKQQTKPYFWLSRTV